MTKTEANSSIFVAGASYPPDTSLSLDCNDGLFKIRMMWGTNTDEHQGANITTVDGISLDQLESRMFEDASILFQDEDYMLEVEVCEIFAEFIFTAVHRDSVSLSVSLEVLTFCSSVLEN